MNDMVSVTVGMLHGCLEIARNHVISVKLLKLLVSFSVFENQFAFSWRNCFMKMKLIWDRNKKENVFQDKLSEEGY